MNNNKRKKLAGKGWKVGSVEEFLQLTPEESAYIEFKLALSKKIKDYRIAKKLTQIELAQRIHSSQSRVAKIEAGDPSVSLDLMVKSLFALGARTKKNLAGAFI